MAVKQMLILILLTFKCAKFLIHQMYLFPEFCDKSSLLNIDPVVWLNIALCVLCNISLKVIC